MASPDSMPHILIFTNTLLNGMCAQLLAPTFAVRHPICYKTSFLKFALREVPCLAV